MPDPFIQNEDAVTIQISYILSLLILIIFTGGITAAFYLYADSSSEKAMRVGFTDLGSVIARDITNMYLTSEYSQNNVSLNVTRNIPLTIGGKGYRIELKNATQDHFASIDIIESGFNGYRVSTTLNSINYPMKASGIVYSGSGEINIRFKKNERLWIH
jgi:hypothetical protein